VRRRNEKYMYMSLVREDKGKKVLGRSRYRRNNDIHRDLAEMVCVCVCVCGLVSDYVQRREFVHDLNDNYTLYSTRFSSTFSLIHFLTSK